MSTGAGKGIHTLLAPVSLLVLSRLRCVPACLVLYACSIVSKTYEMRQGSIPFLAAATGNNALGIAESLPYLKAAHVVAVAVWCVVVFNRYLFFDHMAGRQKGRAGRKWHRFYENVTYCAPKQYKAIERTLETLTVRDD